MTIEEVYFMVAETRFSHGRITLEDAEHTADGWDVYLRDPAHPCAYRVRDYHAYQAYAPALPADWLVPWTSAEGVGPDDGTTHGTITLPQLAQLLVADTAGSIWQLHAIHHAITATQDISYVVEVLDTTTREVRIIPTVAAYLRMCQSGVYADGEAAASWRETRHSDGNNTHTQCTSSPTRSVHRHPSP